MGRGNPRKLYHYTDLTGLRGIVEDGKVWLTHHAYLNDRTELCAGDALFQALSRAELRKHMYRERDRAVLESIAHPEAWADLVGQIQQSVFVCSLTTRRDSLQHWQGYGKGRTAVAIEFDCNRLTIAAMTGSLPENADDSGKIVGPAVHGRLEQCVYDPWELRRAFRALCVSSRQHAAELENEGIFKLLTIGGILRLRARFKHPAFVGEDEWRLLFHNQAGTSAEIRPLLRTTERGYVPYVELPILDLHTRDRIPLTAVWLGPQHDRETMAPSVKSMLRQNGYDDVPVFRSNVPLR